VAHLSQNRPRAATEGVRPGLARVWPGSGPGLALRVFSEPHNVAALADLLAEVTVEPFVRFAATASPVAGKTMEFTGTRGAHDAQRGQRAGADGRRAPRIRITGADVRRPA
jgi:hypothetical protein